MSHTRAYFLYRGLLGGICISGNREVNGDVELQLELGGLLFESQINGKRLHAASSRGAGGQRRHPIRLDARASGNIMPAPLPIDGTDSRALGANSAPADGLVLGTMLQAASEEEARISSVRPCPCDQGVPHYQASFSEAGQVDGHA